MVTAAAAAKSGTSRGGPPPGPDHTEVTMNRIRRVRRGGFYAESRDAVWDFAAALRLPHYFRLGLLGFFGTLDALDP